MGWRNGHMRWSRRRLRDRRFIQGRWPRRYCGRNRNSGSVCGRWMAWRRWSTWHCRPAWGRRLAWHYRWFWHRRAHGRWSHSRVGHGVSRRGAAGSGAGSGAAGRRRWGRSRASRCLASRWCGGLRRPRSRAGGRGRRLNRCRPRRGNGSVRRSGLVEVGEELRCRDGPHPWRFSGWRSGRRRVCHVGSRRWVGGRAPRAIRIRCRQDAVAVGASVHGGLLPLSSACSRLT